METQNETNWLNEEVKTLSQHADYEELPSLKLTPNVVTEITIDFSKPFEKWEGENNGKPVIKKIIPVSVNGTKMNWWLNVKNPFYKEVLTAGINKQSSIKVLQTGTQQNTKYVLVK
jgi:hypothetical protein